MWGGGAFLTKLATINLSYERLKPASTHFSLVVDKVGASVFDTIKWPTYKSFSRPWEEAIRSVFMNPLCLNKVCFVYLARRMAAVFRWELATLNE